MREISALIAQDVCSRNAPAMQFKAGNSLEPATVNAIMHHQGELFKAVDEIKRDLSNFPSLFTRLMEGQTNIANDVTQMVYSSPNSSSSTKKKSAKEDSADVVKLRKIKRKKARC